jgi:hypothetical protein
LQLDPVNLLLITPHNVARYINDECDVNLKFDYALTGKGSEEYMSAYNRYKDRRWFSDPYIGPPSSKDDSAFEEWRTGASSLSPADYWAKYKNPTLVFYGEFETYNSPVLILLF